ncbi:MAG: hypothetical protein KF889_25470 [Alphaproteobacteria bacterium]|nr:hypothetical protein [Alphaproteobacteria bacterium]MCW5739655.1 hypothetical protein [Alphaproteobacteria bacterium]
MSAARKPWIKWYGADWRADPALRMCGFAARGLWIDLLSLMQEAEPFGHLVVKGTVPTTAQLASLLGGSEREVKKLLDELKLAGVYSVTDKGVIFSRRMVRDKAKAEKDAENGGRGGNPTLKGNDKPPDNPKGGNGVNPPHKAHMPEARGQKPEPQGQRGSPEPAQPSSVADPPPPPSPSGDPGPMPAFLRRDPRGRCLALVEKHFPSIGNDLRAYPSLTASLGQIDAWLAEGADLERDVLPAIDGECLKLQAKSKPPRGFGWFAEAVAAAKARNTTPLPDASGDGSADDGPLRAMLERLYAERGTWDEAWKWRDHWGPRPDRRKDAA